MPISPICYGDEGNPSTSHCRCVFGDEVLVPSRQSGAQTLQLVKKCDKDAVILRIDLVLPWVAVVGSRDCVDKLHAVPLYLKHI